MKIFAITLTILLFVGFNHAAYGKIYRCTDEKGLVHFSSRPNIPKCFSPADLEEYRQAEEERIKKVAEAEKARLAKGPIRIGMTTKQVLQVAGASLTALIALRTRTAFTGNGYITEPTFILTGAYLQQFRTRAQFQDTCSY